MAERAVAAVAGNGAFIHEEDFGRLGQGGAVWHGGSFGWAPAARGGRARWAA